ncbi:MAG: 3-dehydroquinate synthase [Firmicutes bacterium]|nr:3-dehydroquinate synthase [Bacillota bacterium]
MGTLQVNLGARSYPILIGSSILPELGRYLVPLHLSPRIFVVTNEIVGGIYGKQVRDALAKAGFEVVYHELPDGEEYKSLDSASLLYTCALKGGVERQSALVALGGGVIGDLAGFVAATFLRGIPLVQVPTTLLAQVDSSVGGKVAVNHPKGKNMIGCFYQPLLVFTDVATLRTLPLRELRAGLAEVIKYGVIWDEGFFYFLEENLDRVLACDQEVLVEIIKQACAIKAKIVEKDERELGLRAILNFGHTVGHALETLTDYRVYRHGEAVSIGMVAAATLAVKKGVMDPGDRERLIALLERAGLPTRLPFDAGEILAILPRDKKVYHGKLRFVLPLGLGQVDIFSDLEPEEIRTALEECREKGRDGL